MSTQPDPTVVATGLEFPEGPIAMPDGSILLVEIARGTLSRVDMETGEVSVVAPRVEGPTVPPWAPTAISTYATTVDLSGPDIKEDSSQACKVATTRAVELNAWIPPAAKWKYFTKFAMVSP